MMNNQFKLVDRFDSDRLSIVTIDTPTGRLVVVTTPDPADDRLVHLDGSITDPTGYKGDMADLVAFLSEVL